eukprot:3527197-Pyramimonas_sp.AAC.1
MNTPLVAMNPALVAMNTPLVDMNPPLVAMNPPIVAMNSPLITPTRLVANRFDKCTGRMAGRQVYERYLAAFWEQEGDLHQRAMDRYNGLVADVARYDGYPPEEQARMLQVRYACVTLTSRLCHAHVALVSRSRRACVTLASRLCHARVRLVSRSRRACVTLTSRLCHARASRAAACRMETLMA